MSIVVAGGVTDVALNNTGPNPYGDVVFPPPQQRSIIDKTASFIAQNGIDFENRMLREPDSQERFAFLFPHHPYRAYYDLKVKEFQSGKVEVAKPAIPQAIIEMRRKEEEKKEKLLMLKSYADKADDTAELSGDDDYDPVAPQESPPMTDENADGDTSASAPKLHVPESDRFLLKHPYIAAIDQEIVKLTAQFVAVNGQSFLAGLIQRERNNPQFDFLKPTHPTHNYFTALIDSYQQCFKPDEDILRKVATYAGRLPLKRPTVNPDGKEVAPPLPTRDETVRFIVRKMRQRHLWNVKQDEDRRAKEEQEAGERAAMAAIDWDNFVVVETIVFTEADSQVSLPVPFTNLGVNREEVPVFTSNAANTLPPPVPMAQQADKKDAPSISRPPQPQGSDSGINVMLSEQVVPVIQPVMPTAEPVAPPVAPVAAAAAPLPLSVPTTTTTMVDGQEATIVLKPDYVRRGKRGLQAGRPLLQKCPITGQLVPPEEMEKHLRVVLIDPQWKRQKDELLARAQKEKALSHEMDVEANIAQFVMKRPDLFGTVEDELLEHAPPKKRSNV